VPQGRVLRLCPDIAVLDVAAPVAEARAIRETAPDTPLVVIGAAETADAHIIRCAAAGVRALIPSDVPAGEFAATLANIASGHDSCCPRIAGALMRHPGLCSSQSPPGCSDGRLTAREWEIADLVREGRANKEIARLLCIELSTVKTHIHHILAKLQLIRRGEISAWVHNASDESKINRRDD
jgi:two-component system, NarL family, nitrate/nitrite response regulator NarL